VADPDTEAARSPATGGRRALVIALAAAAAAGAAALAPEPWPTGPGRLRVEWRGVPAVDAPVAVGTTALVEAAAEAGGARVSIRLPGGAPADAPVRASVRVERPAGPAPAAADLRVALRLPDGREALLPVTGRGEGGTFEALRRPPVRAAPVLAILAFVVVLWVTEAVPLFVASLLVPVALVASGSAPARDALAPFFDPVIALFLGGFLMAEAMRRAGLDRAAAARLVAAFGRSPAALFAALIGTSALLSLGMSNTAAAALVIPVALTVAEPLGSGFRRAAVLGVAYAATVGGMGSLVGTPANLLASRFLGEFTGRPIHFAGWFGWGLPAVLLLLPVVGVHLWRSLGASVDPSAFAEARRRARDAAAAQGRPPGAAIVLAVFAVVVAGWFTEGLHGVDAGVVALGGAVLLALAGRIGAEDLGRISWDSLLTFGGGLALGLAVVRSGASDAVAAGLEGLGSLPHPAALAAVGAITLLVTAAASNTAAAAAMIPLAIPLAGVLGTGPAETAVVVALASSVDFALVVGTPPTLIAYATGLFRSREILRAGALLDLAGLVVVTLLAPLAWRALGLT
jgi:sodium-dependent dicarboxylate transporter 2/3/5